MYFSSCFPFPGYVFTLCFLGGPRRPVGRPKKRHFFGWRFFGVRKNDVFSRETIRCFLAPALSLRRRIPYLSANRLEPRISRDQHIQTSQFKTTNVKIPPAVPKVLKCTLSSSPLVRWKWPTQVGILGTLWWGWELGMMQSTTSAGVSEKFFLHTKKKTTFFRASVKMLFFRATAPGWRSEKYWLSGWLAIWLAGWLSSWLAISDSLATLAGWLFGHWLCGCLAGYLAISYLAGLALAIWLALWMARSLACYLSGYLDGWLGGGLLTGLIGWWLARWLADWVVAWLAACLAGRLTGGAGRLVIWLAIWLAGWLFGWLSNWLKGYLALDGYLAIWLASYLADWLAACLRGWLAGWLAN